MKVHKIELVVVDFDGYGVDEIQAILESGRYSYIVKKTASETIDVEWDDRHVLNQLNCTTEEALSFFAPEHPDTFIREDS